MYERRRRSLWWLPFVIALVSLAVGVLGFRDVALLSTAQGRCVVGVQPVVLLGFSPSVAAELDCAGSVD